MTFSLRLIRITCRIHLFFQLRIDTLNRKLLENQ